MPVERCLDRRFWQVCHFKWHFEVFSFLATDPQRGFLLRQPYVATLSVLVLFLVSRLAFATAQPRLRTSSYRTHHLLYTSVAYIDRQERYSKAQGIGYGEQLCIVCYHPLSPRLRLTPSPTATPKRSIHFLFFASKTLPSASKTTNRPALPPCKHYGGIWRSLGVSSAMWSLCGGLQA